MRPIFILLISVALGTTLLFSGCATTTNMNKDTHSTSSITKSSIDLTKLSTFGYAPQIKSAKLKRAYQIGSYLTFLYDDIKSIGNAQYLYILAVVKLGEKEPCFLISSEVALIHLPNFGSHFLCYFDGKGHGNMGASNDWADLKLFTAKALSIAVERFQISDSVQELPLSR
jgi:hypothetical protein